MISYAELQAIEESASCPECQYKAGLLLEAISDWPVYGLQEPSGLLTSLRAEVGETLTADTIAAFAGTSPYPVTEDWIWKKSACTGLIEFLREQSGQLSRSRMLEDAIIDLEERCGRLGESP